MKIRPSIALVDSILTDMKVNSLFCPTLIIFALDRYIRNT